MSEDYFYIGEVKIFPDQVTAYLNKEGILEKCGHSYTADFESEKFWQSNEEKMRFLMYLGFSEEGIGYYLENGLEKDVAYDVYTILSRTELYNELKSGIRL